MTRLDEALRRSGRSTAARWPPHGPAGPSDEAARQPRPARGLVVWLAGVTGTPAPPVGRRRVVIAAADHGVAMRQQVSAWPSEVTAQMVATFLAGRAAISTIAAAGAISIVVLDVGVASPIPAVEGASTRAALVSAKVRPGTADFTTGPAMTAADRGRDRGWARRGRPGGRGRGRAPRRRRDGDRQHDRGQRPRRGADRPRAARGDRPRDRRRRRRLEPQGRRRRAWPRRQPTGRGRPARDARGRRRARDRGARRADRRRGGAPAAARARRVHHRRRCLVASALHRTSRHGLAGHRSVEPGPRDRPRAPGARPCSTSTCGWARGPVPRSRWASSWRRLPCATGWRRSRRRR